MTYHVVLGCVALLMLCNPCANANTDANADNDADTDADASSHREIIHCITVM